MDEFSTTSDNLDQTDEDILTYTVSNEVLEAAATSDRFVTLFTYNQSMMCGCPPAGTFLPGC
jgi:hypothetical protein